MEPTKTVGEHFQGGPPVSSPTAGRSGTPFGERATGRSPETWTGVLILVSTLVRLTTAWVVPPLADEAYYWHVGSQYHLSYFDHPPLTYWMAALGHKLDIPGGFVVARLPFLLLFSASTWLMFLIGRRLSGGWAGFYAALLLSSTGYFFFGAGTFALPEGPLVFSWLVSLWFLCGILFDSEPKRGVWWLGLGASMGLGALSKYHAIFIPLGAGLAIMTVPRLRHRVRGTGPYLAIVVAAVGALPVLVWNAQHDWISFAYQLGRGTRFHGIEIMAALKNLGGQALLLLPWIWFFLAWKLVRGLARGPRSSVEWFLSVMAAVPIAVFTVLSVRNGQWYMFHWPLVGYLSLFPPLGATVAVAIQRRSAWVRPALWLSTAAMPAACSLIVMYCLLSTSRVISQPMARSAPSMEMARNYDLWAYSGLAGALARRGLLSGPNLFVITDDYMDAGRVAWALHGRVPVLCFSLEDGPKSYVFNEHASGYRGGNGLAVSRSEDVAADLALFSPYFQRTTDLGTVLVGFGSARTVLHLHLFENMIRPFRFAYGAQARAWDQMQ